MYHKVFAYSEENKRRMAKPADCQPTHFATYIFIYLAKR